MSFKGAKVQSIAIPIEDYTLEQANKFIEDHHFIAKFGNKTGPHTTDNYYRYRQKNPDKRECVHFVTVPFGKNSKILVVLEYDEKCFKAKGHIKTKQDASNQDNADPNKAKTVVECSDCSSRNIKKTKVPKQPVTV